MALRPTLGNENLRCRPRKAGTHCLSSGFPLRGNDVIITTAEDDEGWLQFLDSISRHKLLGSFAALWMTRVASSALDSYARPSASAE